MMGILQSGWAGGSEINVTLINLSLNNATSLSVAYTGAFAQVQFGVQRPYRVTSCGSRFVFLCVTPAAFSSPWATWFWDMYVCPPGQACSGAIDQPNAWSLVNLVDPSSATTLGSVAYVGPASKLSQPGITDFSDSWMIVVEGVLGTELDP
jgi:hypothetical protein